jgi:abequosyltransferase
MTAKPPLLSICIATYNRAGFIRETLDSILPQMEDDVELLVVDGASTDDTESVARDVASKEPRLRYVRLPAKGGVDQDYDRSVELARGEFCWLFTDDDLMRPGAIASVRAAVRGGHDLVVVNAQVRDQTLSHVLEQRRIVTRLDRTYAPGEMEALFVDALSYLTFIGAVVVRRSLWLGRDRQRYFGTEFIHVGVLFQAPLPGSALVIAEPRICIRFGNAQWTQRSFGIWMFQWPRLVWSFAHISDESKRSVTPEHPWLSLRTLVVQRSLGSYDGPTYARFLEGQPVSRGWRWCAQLIAHFPRKPIVFLHFLSSRIRGAEARDSFDANFGRAGKGRP